MRDDGDTPPPETNLTEPADEYASIHTFRLDATGLRRVLGPLEADVLEAVWQLTSQDSEHIDAVCWTTIGAVCETLGPHANYRTIQTIMNRLVEKQLLERRERQRAYEYRALPTRSALEAAVTRSVVESLVRDFGGVAIAQLVRAVHDVHPEQLALLERLAGAAAHETPSPVVEEGAPEVLQTQTPATSPTQPGRRGQDRHEDD
jgi:predicted transcriptional regulator